MAAFLACQDAGHELIRNKSETEWGPEVQNDPTRELISTQNTSHKYNNKDLSHLR